MKPRNRNLALFLSLMLTATSLLVIGLVCPASAQEVIGYSELSFNKSASEVDTWSETDMDAQTAANYDAYVVGYVFINGSNVNVGSAQGNPSAGGGFPETLTIGDTYEIDSYHYLVQYFSYYSQGNYYYYNPDYYLFSDGGGFDPSGWGFTDGGGPLYYENYQLLELGATWVYVDASKPNITNINPASASVETSGTITLGGTNLEDIFTQSTQPAITGSGVTLSVQSASPTQAVLNYSIAENATPGEQSVTLTTYFGTSNAESFNVGDSTPVVTSVSPPTWQAGTQFTVTISGKHFGTNPSVSVLNATGVAISPPTNPGDTQFQATVTVDPSAPAETVTVQVQSNGYGSGFVATTPGQSPDGSSTADVVALQLPTPQIMMVASITDQQNCTGGTQIAGQTTSVNPGQQILLCSPTPNGLPAGATVTSSWYTVNDQADLSGGYCAPYASTQCGDAGQELADPDLYATNVAFYWINPDSTEDVTYIYCINNSSTQCAVSQPASFDINGPTGNLLLQANMPVDGSGVRVFNVGGSPWLKTTGVPVPGGSVGITFTSNAQPQAGSNQAFTWVQVLNSMQYQYINSLGPFANPPAPESGLDSTYPYANVSPTTTYDSPGAALPPNYGEGWESFTATMYLMWDPALPSGCIPASTDANQVSTRSTCTSIPVPLSSVTWHWSGCAINTLANQPNNTTWILSPLNGCPVQTLGAPQTAGFPEWTNIIH